MLNIYHSPGMWPHRFQLWWVAATFLPQEVYPCSFSLLFFSSPPCPDSAFEHGQWLTHQPKSLSWNTLTCHMCHCRRTWGFPGLTGVIFSGFRTQSEIFPALLRHISDPSDYFYQIKNIELFFILCFRTVNLSQKSECKVKRSCE